MKKNILITTIIFIVATIMCYGYVIGHYSIDNYNISNIGYNQYSILNNLKEGRPVMFLIDQLALKLNIDYQVFFIITVVLAILITSIAVTIFYNIIIKYFENKSTINKIILLLISYTIFFNFMYIENLYFVESIVMALALLLYLISANWLVNRKHIVWSVVLATIATLCYNGFVCYYVTIVLILSIFKNRKNYKSIIKDVIISGLIIVFSVIINFIQIKIVCNILDSVNNRLGKLTNILYNAKVIIKYLLQLFIESAGLFPKYLYLIF